MGIGQLAGEGWHFCHERVIDGLDTLRSSRAIDAMTHVAWWVPEYLDFDEYRVLARKAA